MTYDFRLDKKGVISLVAGWAVLGILLFAAGWISGMYWTTGGGTPSAPTPGKTVNTADNTLAALPQQPVIREDAFAADLAAPGRGAEALRQEVAPPRQLNSALQVPGAAALGGGPPVNKTAPAPGADTQEKIIQAAPEAPAAAASATSENVGAGSTIFTVQVGAFLDQHEASRLINAMEEKGYAPSFFADRDAENRQWYAVRIGAYADKDQAANAAANFTKQERIKAVVRPLGSL